MRLTPALHPPHRRRALFQRLLAWMLVAAAVTAAPAAAQNAPTRLVIDRGGAQGSQITVTVAPFFVGRGGAPQAAAREAAEVIAADLGSTAAFRAVRPDAWRDYMTDFDSPPRFSSAQAASDADALVTGEIALEADGRLRMRFRLWDVAARRQILGFQYRAAAPAARRMAHRAADRIYERLANAKGLFESRLVFIDETGPKDRRVKRLAVMDSDGEGVRHLSDGADRVISPQFSPTGRMVSYVTYRHGAPRAYLFDLETGRQELLVRGQSGLTFSPSFAPDGRRMALSLTLNDGQTDIYLMNLATRRLTRVTDHPGADTSPTFSPDGRSLAFESDRDGDQQIYVLPLSGGPARRISSGPGRFAEPAWSPRGDLIAFTRMLSGQFGVGVMNPSGGGTRMLTQSYLDEGPTWAPNGERLAFTRETRGETGTARIYVVDAQGGTPRQLQTPNGASDVSWGPLMSAVER